MNKYFVALILVGLLMGTVFGLDLIKVEEKKRDIPLTLNPVFVEKITACGKLDLIDRLSSKYNPKALVDGSLNECDK